MPLKAGDAFHMSGTGGFTNPGGAHLCVCLTSPCEKGNILVVTIISYKPGFDKGCLLCLGDHKDIRWDSCASYADAKKIYGTATEKLIGDGTYGVTDNVSPELLSRLRRGLFASGDTPPFILEYAKKRGLSAKS